MENHLLILPKFQSKVLQGKQAKRLKSHERRPEVDRLDGKWALWSMGMMVHRLDGW